MLLFYKFITDITKNKIKKNNKKVERQNVSKNINTKYQRSDINIKKQKINK